MTTPINEKLFPEDEKLKLPRPFILRRLHSFMGLWLVIYLAEHLFVNSLAALYFHDGGQGFISAVSKINDLPYLKVIEIVFLAFPFLVHGIWGIKYALTSKTNSHRTDGSTPSLPQYKRNKAYTWQRITSWLLIIGILGHVIQMRFWEYPSKVAHGEGFSYFLRMKYDPALPLVAEKQKIQLYNQSEIEEKKQELKNIQEKIKPYAPDSEFKPDDPYYHLKNEEEKLEKWLKGAEKKSLKKGDVLAIAPNAGSAFFLIVRQTFKSPVMVVLYSLFVFAATFHAFNGLWTLLITWGVTLTRRSQKTMRTMTTSLMWIVSILGLMAIWGTYWTTLFQR